MSKSLMIYGLALLCFVGSQAQKTIAGFPINKKAFSRSSLKSLRKAVEVRELKDITSIVVIKDGALLVEEYFNDASRLTLHDTRSLTKSFTSTLMGIALEEGHIQSLDQKLGDFYDLKDFKNYSKEKNDVTLRSLLTMSSGFDGFDFDPSSPGNEENMYPTKDWVKFALDLPMKTFTENNLQWQYFTAGVVILGDILDQKVPGGLENYAKQKLFDPLDIEEVIWQYTPTNVPNTAGSCQLSSLDFAKYGQLYNNQGRWQNRRVLSSEWIDQSFTKYYELPDNLAYGFLFWNKSYLYENETFAASGNGGNKVFVFQEWDLVVVITATAYNQPYAHKQADKIIEKFVLPGLKGIGTHP